MVVRKHNGDWIQGMYDHIVDNGLCISIYEVLMNVVVVHAKDHNFEFIQIQIDSKAAFDLLTSKSPTPRILQS